MRNKKGTSKIIEFLIVAALLGLFFIIVSYVFIGQGLGKTVKDMVSNAFKWVGEKLTTALGGTPAIAGETSGEGTSGEGGRKTYYLSVGASGGVHTTPGAEGEYTVWVDKINDITKEVEFTVFSNIPIGETRKSGTIKATTSEDGCSEYINLCIKVLSVDKSTKTVSFQVYAITGVAGQEIVYGEVTRMQKGEEYLIKDKGLKLKYYEIYKGDTAIFELEGKDCQTGPGAGWRILFIERCHTCCAWGDNHYCGVIESIAPDKSYVDFKFCDVTNPSYRCGVPHCFS